MRQLNNPIYIGLIILLILVGLVILVQFLEDENERGQVSTRIFNETIGGNLSRMCDAEDLESELEDDVTVSQQYSKAIETGLSDASK